MSANILSKRFYSRNFVHHINSEITVNHGTVSATFRVHEILAVIHGLVRIVHAKKFFNSGVR